MIAADMLAQAEHDTDAHAPFWLRHPSALASAVRAQIEEQLETLPTAVCARVRSSAISAIIMVPDCKPGCDCERLRAGTPQLARPFAVEQKSAMPVRCFWARIHPNRRATTRPVLATCCQLGAARLRGAFGCRFCQSNRRFSNSRPRRCRNWRRNHHIGPRRRIRGACARRGGSFCLLTQSSRRRSRPSLSPRESRREDGRLSSAERRAPE